jgi:endonuclease G
LTQKYASVRVFTGPLYLPRQYPDGKWRVTYEVIGNPPSVAVPTHFFKVIVAEGKDDQGPVTVGAFVLPNQEINNSTALTVFDTPVEAVERYFSI